MPILSIRGEWYGGSCVVFSGEYANLGLVPDTNYILENTGSFGSCGGFKFVVKRGDTGQVIYNSTSAAKQVSLYFDGQPQQTRYDCLNGACISALEYGTPGFYSSLEECEQVCGSQGCSGKCISNSDWVKIQGLASKLKNQNCG